jgi:hypothetical protein
VCVAVLNSWNCAITVQDLLTNMGGACVKPNVTHVTLSTRYVREWGTWPARDARTVNPNFVRFKTWDWDCGRGNFADWGLTGPKGGCCPRFRLALFLSLPSHHRHLHCLSLSLSHPTTQLLSARATCLISIKNHPATSRAGWVCGGLAAELRPPHLVQ